MSLAILSWLSWFPPAQFFTNLPFSVDMPLNNQPIFGKPMLLYQSLLSHRLSHHRLWRCSFPNIDLCSTCSTTCWPMFIGGCSCCSELMVFVVSQLILNLIFSPWSLSLLVMICRPSYQLLSKAMSSVTQQGLPCWKPACSFLRVRSSASFSRFNIALQKTFPGMKIARYHVSCCSHWDFPSLVALQWLDLSSLLERPAPARSILRDEKALLKERLCHISLILLTSRRVLLPCQAMNGFVNFICRKLF